MWGFFYAYFFQSNSLILVAKSPIPGVNLLFCLGTLLPSLGAI